MSIKKTRLKNDLNFIKISFSVFVLLLLAVLPILTSQIITTKRTQDTRSSADDDIVIGPIQSWIVSPNGGDIVYGDTEVQFFARNASDAAAKFSFDIDLLKGDRVVRDLFTYDQNNTLANREGIRSVYYDFSGLEEGSDYRLKLRTVEASGTNVIEDYSDNTFTIASNTSKPEFTSSPSTYNLYVGEEFVYEIRVEDALPIEILTPSLPGWLRLEGNRLVGTPSEAGIYSVTIIAVNTAGQQSSQIFSLNVLAAPDSNGGETVPTPSSQTLRSESIKVTLPDENIISKSNSKINLEIPDSIASQVTKITAEISKNGKTWEKAYEGKESEFNLDISRFEGGDYSLRIIYEFSDGKKEIKNLGPIKIVKQDSNPEVSVLTISDIKPIENTKIEDRKPIISGSFLKPNGINIDLKSFKFTLDGNDLSTSPNLRSNQFSFSYVPDGDLNYGRHTVKVELSSEGEETAQKTWSFEIIDPAAAAEQAKTEEENILKKNKVLIGIIAGIILLILILSIWAIALSRKEKHYFSEERTYVD